MYLSSRAPPPQHRMYLAITMRPRPLSRRACERAAVDQTTSTSTPPNHAELLSRETERRHPHVNLMTSLSYDIICSQFSPSFGASVRKSSSLIRLLLLSSTLLKPRRGSSSQLSLFLLSAGPSPRPAPLVHQLAYFPALRGRRYALPPPFDPGRPSSSSAPRPPPCPLLPLFLSLSRLTILEVFSGSINFSLIEAPHERD